MVTLQILVLSFWVRILAGQHFFRHLPLSGKGAFFFPLGFVNSQPTDPVSMPIGGFVGVLLGFCWGFVGVFSANFLARQASKTPNVPNNKAPVVKPQLSSAQRHPAPGFRDAGNNRGYGTLYYVGSAGYFWSSSIPAGSGNAHFLDFYYYGVYPQGHNSRAYGLQLRCLQEEGEGTAGHANRACGQKSGSASLASHTPSSPNPLGENQSLSSPPLKPRRLLLSAMRQKVGKERSQGVFAPLAIPRCYPNLAETTLAKRPVGALRDLQEHPEGVLLVSPPNLEPGLAGKKVRPRARCRSTREPGSLYPRPRTAMQSIATNSAPSSAGISP